MLNHQVVIIEDEIHSSKRLKQLLAGFDNVEVLGEATDGEEGVKLINQKQPDLIFLDIAMPVLSGFEMLERLQCNPKVIFTTAYEEYALKAFEANSVDYLLKPFSEERLQQAIDKVERFAGGMDTEKVRNLLSAMQQEKKLNSISVRVGDRIVIVPCEEIPYINSEDKCSVIYDLHGNRYLTYHPLSKLIDRLPGNFLQVRQDYVINRHYIYEIRKSFKGKLVFIMNDGNNTRITTGKTFIKHVKNHLEVL